MQAGRCSRVCFCARAAVADFSPRYTGNAGIYPIYECTARHEDTIYRKDCVTIQASLVDQAISRRILEVLQPEQLEIALRALKELEERSEAIDRQWRMRIERLEYQAQLAQRRYEEVDPSHRLVAALSVSLRTARCPR